MEHAIRYAAFFDQVSQHQREQRYRYGPVTERWETPKIDLEGQTPGFQRPGGFRGPFHHPFGYEGDEGDEPGQPLFPRPGGVGLGRGPPDLKKLGEESQKQGDSQTQPGPFQPVSQPADPLPLEGFEEAHQGAAQEPFDRTEGFPEFSHGGYFEEQGGRGKGDEDGRGKPGARHKPRGMKGRRKEPEGAKGEDCQGHNQKPPGAPEQFPGPDPGVTGSPKKEECPGRKAGKAEKKGRKGQKEQEEELEGRGQPVEGA
jgi:hypothetical protein